jgi:hypothetical protein
MSETEWDRVERIRNEHRKKSEEEELRTIELIEIRKRLREIEEQKIKEAKKKKQILEFNSFHENRYKQTEPQITYGIHRCLMDNLIDSVFYKNNLLMLLHIISCYLCGEDTKSVRGKWYPWQSRYYEEWLGDVISSARNNISFYNNGAKSEVIKHPVQLTEYESNFLVDALTFKGRLNYLGLRTSYKEIIKYQSRDKFKLYLRTMIYNYMKFVEYCITEDWNNSCLYNNAGYLQTHRCKNLAKDKAIAQNIFYNKNEWVVKYYNFFKSRGLYDILYVQNYKVIRKSKLSFVDMREIRNIIHRGTETMPDWDKWMKQPALVKFANTKEKYRCKMGGFRSRPDLLCSIESIHYPLCRLAFTKLTDLSLDIIELVIEQYNSIEQ